MRAPSKKVLTDLLDNSMCVHRTVYLGDGYKYGCTGCGVVGKHALKLKHKKGCVFQVYWDARELVKAYIAT